MINTDDCMLWARAIDGGGYGRLGHNKYAHRVMWEVFNNKPIPDGYEVDHLCEIRRCINPEHLEAVTPQENTLRSDGIASKCAQKTHCPQGHEYSENNIYRTKRGYRICRTCNIANSARQRARVL